MQELQEHLNILVEEHKQEKMAWTAKLEDELASASTQHSQQMKAQECSYKEQIESLEAKYVFYSIVTWNHLTYENLMQSQSTIKFIRPHVYFHAGTQNYLRQKHVHLTRKQRKEFRTL